MEVKIKQIEEPIKRTQTHGKKGLELEKLTFGFIREIEQEIAKCGNTKNSENLLIERIEEERVTVVIPIPIMQICVDYGIEESYAWFGIYDELHSEIELKSESMEETETETDSTKNIIKSWTEYKAKNNCLQYQLLKGNEAGGGTSDVVYLSTIGFNIGIHEIVVKCIKAHPNDKFGIVENNNINTLHNLGRIYLYNQVFKERYYWWRHTRNVWHKSNYHRKIDNGIQWENGDTIKMRIDCDHWTLQFFKNDKQVLDAFSIKENITYYPVITNGDTRCVYHHILPFAL